jgi:cytoskeletal protein RodZ
MNPVQNPLFKEPVGMTFKIRREQLGLTLEDISKSLKFGSHIVHAIELEQWDKLGPSIYANSYINSYIKLLELSPEIRNEIPRFKGDTTLKLIAEPRLSSSTSLSKAIFAILIVISLAALIAFLYSRNQPVLESMPSAELSMSAEIPSATMIAKNPLNQSQVASEPASVTTQSLATQGTEINTPIDSTLLPVTPANNEMTIKTIQETWMEIRDSQNAVVFNELIPANQERTQSIKNVGKITLGNASKTEISINGVSVQLASFINNDVARFTVDENGKAVALTQ